MDFADFLWHRAPPPPPNAGVIPTPTDAEPKQTIRKKLELHRTDPNCAACHAKIDPLGFALDNYDAIGRWRTVEDSQVGVGEAPMIDASGRLPDGRTFSGPAEFKQRLLDDIDTIAIAFTEKLATYALRRGLTYSERLQVKQIAEQAKADDYRLQSLIQCLVLSDLFRVR